MVDVTGWSQFYGRREGYTFENLVAAQGDPAARWVVAREAHLKGPWEYCGRLRALVDGLEPVAVFRARSAAARRRSTSSTASPGSPRARGERGLTPTPIPPSPSPTWSAIFDRPGIAPRPLRGSPGARTWTRRA